MTALKHLVAQLPLHVRHMVNVAIKTRCRLDPASPQVRGLLVLLNGLLHVTLVKREASRKTTASSIAWPTPWAKY